MRYANHAMIDADYARWWYGQMDAIGWCNPDDATKSIGNWKTMLRAWWFKRSKLGDNNREESICQLMQDDMKRPSENILGIAIISAGSSALRRAQKRGQKEG